MRWRAHAVHITCLLQVHPVVRWRTGPAPAARFAWSGEQRAVADTSIQHLGAECSTSLLQ